MTHLGQIIAGFKKGCNHRYWEIIGQGEVAATATNSTIAPIHRAIKSHILFIRFIV